MSDYAARRVSEAELSVMEVLWEQGGKPLAAKDLQVTLKERRGWERTTVRSLLTRLADKGSVIVGKESDVAVYSPSFTMEEYRWDLTETLLSRLYDDDAKVLIDELLKHGVLSREDLTS